MRSKVDLLQELEDNFKHNFDPIPKKILVALSGGIDSLALVLIAKEWCNQHNIFLKSVTIDHKLRPNSSIEAEQVGQIMKENNIDHQILPWNREGKLIGNIESTARQARYELLSNHALQENIPIIITAHHLDDQIETFFMRLLRGSGIDGLSAMNIKHILSNNVIIFRPFLNVSKEKLRGFLEDINQKWFEDETNDNTDFLRNKIRKILYNIDDKDIIDKRIAQSTKHFGRAKDFLEKHTEQIFADIVTIEKEKLMINIADFKNLHEEMALRLLIRIFREINGKYNKPRFQNLLNLYHKILHDKICKKTTFAHTIITANATVLIFQMER